MDEIRKNHKSSWSTKRSNTPVIQRKEEKSQVCSIGKISATLVIGNLLNQHRVMIKQRYGEFTSLLD